MFYTIHGYFSALQVLGQVLEAVGDKSMKGLDPSKAIEAIKVRCDAPRDRSCLLFTMSRERPWRYYNIIIMQLHVGSSPLRNRHARNAESAPSAYFEAGSGLDGPQAIVLRRRRFGPTRVCEDAEVKKSLFMYSFH